ncbi:MAG: hypothetical protein ACOY46_12500 [Bacillota bacterium]
MIPKDPEDININASQQGILEIAEHFFRQKMRIKENAEADKDTNEIE